MNEFYFANMTKIEDIVGEKLYNQIEDQKPHNRAVYSTSYFISFDNIQSHFVKIKDK